MILQEKLHSCAELMEYINEIGFAKHPRELVWQGGLPHRPLARGVEAKNIEAALQDSTCKNR